MLQRIVVSALFLLGLLGFGYAFTLKTDSQVILCGFSLILILASSINLMGIRRTKDGFVLRENRVGRLLREWHQTTKGPKEFAHCPLYVTGFVASMMLVCGVAAATGAIYGLYLLIDFFATPTKMQSFDWSEVGATSLIILPYLLGVIGSVIVGVVFVRITNKKLKERTALASQFVFFFVGATLIIASTSDHSFLAAAWALAKLLSTLILFLGAMLCIATLLLTPIWLPAITQRFFPAFYRRLCPVVKLPNNRAL